MPTVTAIFRYCFYINLIVYLAFFGRSHCFRDKSGGGGGGGSSSIGRGEKQRTNERMSEKKRFYYGVDAYTSEG